MLLIDDGTLDTVISVDGLEYRYNWDPDPDIDETYDDFVAWAMRDAVEQHEQGLDDLAHHYHMKGNVLGTPLQKFEWLHFALQEAINGCADKAMLEQALEIVEDLREMEVSA